MIPSVLKLALGALLLTGAPVDETKNVRLRLHESLMGAVSHRDQARKLVELAFLQDDDPELAELARENLIHYRQRVIAPLANAFVTVPPEDRLELLEMADRIYPTIKGTSPDYMGMIRLSLESEDPALRASALSQVGRYRLSRMALIAADVYFLYPESRAESLEALGVLRDKRGVSPALDALTSGDPPLRDLGVRTLARIGRPAAFRLKALMAGDDPELARHAARALLGFANATDLPALHEFALRYGAEDPELGRRMTRAIAEIEVGRYEPPPPEEL